MARERTHGTKLRFAVVSIISYALNSFWVWLLFTHLQLGRGSPDSSDAVRNARRHLHTQSTMGFPLMERAVYEAMAEHDERHWWYRARREVVAALIRRKVTPPKDAQLLEIGCGTGHNLAMLGEFGAVDALEVDEVARGIAEERLGHEVLSAPLPELVGVPDGHYDMVAAFDVIEHIPDDEAALEGIARVLKPGGKLVMTVPAHQWMWSAHDVVNHHQRRYSKATPEAADRRLAAAAGDDRLSQQPAVPGRGRGAPGVEDFAARTMRISRLRPSRSIRPWSGSSRQSAG